jgi:hypothetical protein
MSDALEAFVRCATEAFRLRGPVYQFGFIDSADAASGDVGRRLASSVSGDLMEAIGDDWLTCALSPAAQLDRLPFPENAAGILLCRGWPLGGDRPEKTAQAILRFLRPGGALLVLATTGSASGGARGLLHPSPGMLQRALGVLPVTVVAWQGTVPLPHTVYAVGFKPPLRAEALAGVAEFADLMERRLGPRGGVQRWWRAVVRLLRRALLPGWSKHGGHRRDAIELAVHVAAQQAAMPFLAAEGLSEGRSGTRLDRLG